MKLKTLAMGCIVVTGLFSTYAFAEDNIAACEIVVMRSVIEKNEDQVNKKPAYDTPMVARFYPAADFIFSVFADASNPMLDVEGQPIRAVMCTRENVIPTEFDLKIIRTGIPLHLSQNFDVPDSSLLSVRQQDGVYVHTYAGTDLSEEDSEVLKIRLATLNEPAKNMAKEIVEDNAEN